MIIHAVKQDSPEWFALRCGKFTASNFDKLFMAKSTKGYQDLVNSVVFERLTSEVPESYESDWMRRGKELEPEARLRYELDTFQKVQEVGFVELNEWVGGSPDGFLDEDGLLEIKCPKFNTFIFYALSHEAVKEYQYQVQGELLVTGRKWSELFVYHPKLEPLRFRIERNEEIVGAITKELATAIKTAQERIEQIKEKK